MSLGRGRAAATIGVSSGAAPVRRSAHVATIGTLLGLAILAGAAAATAPLLMLGVAVAAVVVVAVQAHPPFAAYLLVTSALLGGAVGRGVLVPGLRPSEAVTLLVGAALVLRLVLPLASPAVRPLIVRPHRLDGVILALVVTGSLVPAVWMAVRERTITERDLLDGLELWKYFAGYLIVRVGIRTPREVRTCLLVALGAAGAVAAIAVMQSRELLGVGELIRQYAAPDGGLEPGGAQRASSTVGLSFALADLMVYALALLGAWVVRHGPRPAPLLLLAPLFATGVVAAGQVSGAIAIAVAVAAFAVVTRRFAPTAVAALVVGVIAAVALWPVIELRLGDFDSSSGVPQSWAVRYANLSEIFWPELFSDLNWLTGVSLAGRLPGPDITREWVYIESGFTWLLWTGGVAFLVAFLAFLVVCLRTTWAVARERHDAVGVAAIAAFTAFATMAVLMVLDSHLTLRGAVDMAFVLLALALTARR